jgi:hypothetical protein
METILHPYPADCQLVFGVAPGSTAGVCHLTVLAFSVWREAHASARHLWQEFSVQLSKCASAERQRAGGASGAVTMARRQP